ncbi:hypothetical protein CEXT_76611 [Caerostris extrusa]|uniref:Uncharacterized protein n=1 Tax=Caerostris extrusa TaxID=172846 RepID=A0AAV4WHM1_CAEEX|nr:hypothetical protein CEXT_76611 [Caerostris extrusa]
MCSILFYVGDRSHLNAKFGSVRVKDEEKEALGITLIPRGFKVIAEPIALVSKNGNSTGSELRDEVLGGWSPFLS